MTDNETTTEQLVEIEGQAEDTPATEYAPPEGWRVLAVGELLQQGDERVQTDESRYATRQAGRAVQAHERYIRRIDRKPQPIQVREGRWRTRGGHYVCVEPMSGDDFASIAYGYTWRGCNTPELQWNDNGLREIDSGERGPMDLVEYLGPIEPEPQPVNDWPSVRDLRHELKTVQTQLGESRQRVTQLEELVASLRTINETQEKAFEAAGKENTALRLQVQNRQQEYERQKSRIEFLETLNAGNGAAIGDYIAKVAKLQSLVDTARQQLEAAATEHDSLSTQLAAVKAELATQAATSRRLQIELDAAQQVPADSPELRQLRADLAEVTQDRDTYRHAHELLVNDVNATHQRTKVMTIEAIVEWLVPIRTCGSQALATAVISNLPHIMRSLTGLEDEEIE